MAAPAMTRAEREQLRADLAFLYEQGPANSVYMHDIVPILHHILEALLPADMHIPEARATEE